MESETQGEVSIGVEFEAVEGMDQAVRRAAIIRRDATIQLAKWPNQLGETPEDAIGKVVRLVFGSVETDYRVGSVIGKTLCLEGPLPWEAEGK